MAPRPGGTADAVTLLSQMLLDRAITSFVTNFEAVRRSGALPHVRIWIKEADDLSLVRTRRAIEEALRPFLENVRVEVEPDPWIPRGRPGAGGGHHGGAA